MPAKRATKAVLIAVGSVCVALGTLGVFLPLLPTTPFLLLAAACYARSSDRLYAWLLTNKRLGPYIRGYITSSGMPLRAKVVTLVVLWGSILYSVNCLVSRRWVQIFLLAMAGAVTVLVLTRKTLRTEDETTPAPKVDDTGSSG